MAQVKGISRFAALDRAKAVLLLAALMIFLVAAILPQATNTTPASSSINTTAKPPMTDEDLVLYGSIAARVATGESYYDAAAKELRAGVYPLKPFVTFRLPTLAYVNAYLGKTASFGLLSLILSAALWAFWKRLDGAFLNPHRRVSAILLIISGALIVFEPKYAALHELWAGLLIALAVALRGSSRWYLTIITSCAALMIRELALPFIMLMAAFSLFERQWRDLTAWVIVLILFAIVMLAHAHNVAVVVKPDDLSSPGWVEVGGWHRFLAAMRLTSALRVFPEWLGNAGVILAFFGWMSWRSVTGLLGTLLLIGYAIIFMILGRPENFYWGLLVAPVLLVGWVFLPQAMRDLGEILLPRKAN